MSSKRKSSNKSHHDRSVPDGSSSQHVDVVPKVEFSADSIELEEIDAYSAARVKFQRYLRSRRNKSEFETISGEELQERGEDGFWSIQLGRSPNWTGPACRTAELNPWLIQLSRSPNWTGSGPSWIRG
ncbi:hypothetical protein Bca52824_048006 [Brassica carinata]|uniref:Uncharacterized protein n=1 Tax=Brassica carinata TaxID=52824 RepID=A0A8X7RIA8_BRACI|nr:hypothetical protein Bca52824_048006 [Brassica carinata]